MASTIAAAPLAKHFCPAATGLALPPDALLAAELLALSSPARAVARAKQQEFDAAVASGRMPSGKQLQKLLSAPTDEARLRAVVEASPAPRDVARLAAVTAPGASLWVSLPARGCADLWMEPLYFRTAVALRLGAAVAPGVRPCAGCSHPADPLGDHSLCCMSGGHRTLLHHQVASVIAAHASHGLLHPQREVTLARGTGAQRMDIVLRAGFRKTQLVDVAITHPLAPGALAAPPGPGAAATAYEAVKCRTYAGCWDPATEELVPCVFDTFGGIGSSARPLLAKIAAAVAARSTVPKVARLRFWCILNATITRGVAAIVLRGAGIGTEAVSAVPMLPPSALLPLAFAAAAAAVPATMPRPPDASPPPVVPQTAAEVEQAALAAPAAVPATTPRPPDASPPSVAPHTEAEVEQVAAVAVEDVALAEQSG